VFESVKHLAGMVFEFVRNHNLAWLIPALPLLASAFIAVFGKWLKGAAHIPAWIAMAGSFALSITLLLGINADPSQTIKDSQVFQDAWFAAGNFHVPLAINVDQLTAVYLTFITGIGLLIFIFAAGYMKGDYGYWRFFACMSIFVFFMCTLVMGNNFILLYLGWEGVGLASYLLIGYYYPRPAAVAAAKKAFITNRIGDFGLAIGVFLIYLHFGNVTYSEVFAHPAEVFAAHPILKWLPFCLMLGAFGKSAQFPLHVWLPDAMEGPTPVSALIHAATMVTAGIYLIARTMPLFLVDPSHTALNVVACVGGFTAFMAASIAMCQYDLKRIWAYSTLSQLGYMFLGLGVMAGTSAVFHVFTHAFFKALLFLSAGSVMHAMGGELDIRKMSGIRKVMPITHITMLLGCIALAGVPFIGAGFFSKDEIIAAVINSPEPHALLLGVVALLVALMTAYYTFRLYFKVFWGPLELPATAGRHEPSPFALADAHGHEALAASHEHDDHAHAAHTPNDGSPLLWLPLCILCVGAVGAGYLGYKGTGDWFHQFLKPVFQTAGTHVPEATAEGAERVSEPVLLALAFLLPLVGIALAWYFHAKNRPATAALAQRLRFIVNFLNHKWYFDELYAVFLLKPLWLLALLLSYFDRYVIDSLVYIVGFIPQLIGHSLKPTQRGLLPRFAVSMIAGLAAIVLGVLYLLG